MSQKVSTLEYVVCDLCDKPASRINHFGNFCFEHFMAEDENGESIAMRLLDEFIPHSQNHDV